MPFKLEPAHNQQYGDLLVMRSKSADASEPTVLSYTVPQLCHLVCDSREKPESGHPGLFRGTIRIPV